MIGNFPPHGIAAVIYPGLSETIGDGGLDGHASKGGHDRPLVALILGILDGAYAPGATILAFKFSNGACPSSTRKLGQGVWDLLAVRLETDQSSDMALKRPSAPQPEDPLTVVLLC